MKKAKKSDVLNDKKIDEMGQVLAKAIRLYLIAHNRKDLELADAVKVVEEIVKERGHNSDYLEKLQKEHQDEFAYSKRYFQKMTKEGDKSVKGIVKILEAYDSYALISLYHFLKKIPRRTQCNRIFNEIVARAKSYWGTPSYIVKNVLNGTKQESVSKRTKAYRVVAQAVKKAREQFEAHNRLLSVDGVVSVRDGDHYVAFISGGNNGSCNWPIYLQSLTMIVQELKNAWLIEVKNDSCDDVHYALIGFGI